MDKKQDNGKECIPFMKSKMLLLSYCLFLLTMVLGGGYLFQTEVKDPNRTRLEEHHLTKVERFDVYSKQSSKKHPFVLEKEINLSKLLSNRLLLTFDKGKPTSTTSPVFLKLVSNDGKSIYIHKQKEVLTFSFTEKGQRYEAASKQDRRILESLQDYL